MNATVQKWDKYEQKEVIESPLLTSNEPREGIHEDHYYIDAQLKGGRRTYALLLAHYSESWFFLQSAQDSAGKTLSASRLDEEVLSGQIRETFSISVSREYLDRAAETVGLDIQVEGKRNNCYLKVPAYFVRGFLEKVDQIGIK